MKEAAYHEAKRVIARCVTKHGFSAAYPGYQGVWARDSVITSFGASLVEGFEEPFRRSLLMLEKFQSEKGQIPNAVMFERMKGEYKSIDSTLWFIIGHYLYKSRFNDRLFKKSKKSIDKALTWLSYQDMGEDGMLEQGPTSDWQDAFPHRYGHTINTQALYYRVLTLAGKKKEKELLKDAVHSDKNDSLWNGTFYLPWRWKNHNKYHEKGEWFDSLGNLLAIVFGLADSAKANKILDYIKKNKIDVPWPIKAIYPPIYKGSKDWQDYFEDCEARTPYHYLNAGIWTFIGGFYVLALIKVGRFNEAEKQLEQLAKANGQDPSFAEWFDGKSGKPGFSHSGSQDGNQAWNAGMYIMAYESLRKKKVLLD